MRSAIFLALVTAPLGAAEWIKVTSANFELYTTAGERNGKNAIKHFEQIRAFFLSELRFDPKTPAKTRIVGFSSEKEFEPYKPNEGAAAYYLPTADRDYIVMRTLTQDLFPIAVHEYVHLLTRHGKLELPAWLNEGFAEFYSTVTQVGNKVRVGLFQQGRVYTLQQEGWMPLERLFSVDHESPEYNEKSKSGVFYAESWALVHMIKLGQAYRLKSPEALTAIIKGKSAAETMAAVYGKPVSAVQKDLQSYVRQDWQTVYHVDSRLDAKVDNPTVEKLAEVDTELTLAHLKNFTRKKMEAEAIYTRLVNQFPDNLEARESLGYFHLRAGEREKALEQFGAAAKLGSKNATMLRHYGSMLRWKGAPKEEVEVALRRAVEADPSNEDARIELGYHQMSMGKYGAAYSVFLELNKVKPDRGATVLLAMSRCMIHLKNLGNAKTYAQMAAKAAKRPSEAEQARSLLSHVEYLESPPARTQRAVQLAAAPVESADEVRAELESKLSGGFVTTIRKNRDFFVTGTFVDLACAGKQATMTVEAAGKKLKLLIREPDQVLIKGAGTETVEFTCGPQAQARIVTVAYAPPDEDTKADGVVGSIEFQ